MPRTTGRGARKRSSSHASKAACLAPVGERLGSCERGCEPSPRWKYSSRAGPAVMHRNAAVKMVCSLHPGAAHLHRARRGPERDAGAPTAGESSGHAMSDPSARTYPYGKILRPWPREVWTPDNSEGGTMKTKEIQEDLVKRMQHWQKVERESVASTTKVLETDQPPAAPARPGDHPPRLRAARPHPAVHHRPRCEQAPRHALPRRPRRGLGAARPPPAARGPDGRRGEQPRWRRSAATRCSSRSTSWTSWSRTRRSTRRCCAPSTSVKRGLYPYA